MKYLKRFDSFGEEWTTGQIIDYNVGDIVVCVKQEVKAGIPPFTLPKITLKEGNKYKVLKIYEIPEDRYRTRITGNDYLRVDVEDIETGKISKGWRSTYFKAEIEFDADKYNL